MPAAAVYVLAIVGTVAAGIAFKEFVYDPHIAPKFHQWTDDMHARREARRRHRAGAVLVPVPVPVDMQERHTGRNRRRGHSFSDSDETSESGDTSDDRKHGSRNTTREGDYELETLSRGGTTTTTVRDRKTSSNVEEWRVGVDSATLRRRNTRSQQQQESMIPTHILSSPSSLSQSSLSSTSHLLPQSSPAPPPPQLSSPSLPTASNRDSTISSSTLGPTLIDLSTPNLDSNGNGNSNGNGTGYTTTTTSTYPYTSPSLIPSLSLSHPVDPSDAEQGVELLSPPSSRPESPFSSNFSTFSEVSRLEEGETRTQFGVLSSASSLSTSAVRVEPPVELGREFNNNNNGRNGSTLRAGRYLTREEIQRLIDAHASASAPALSTSPTTTQGTSTGMSQSRYLTRPSVSPAPSDSSCASFASFASPSGLGSGLGEVYFTPPMTVGGRSVSVTPLGNVNTNMNTNTRSRSPLVGGGGIESENEVYRLTDSDLDLDSGDDGDGDHEVFSIASASELSESDVSGPSVSSRFSGGYEWV